MSLATLQTELKNKEKEIKTITARKKAVNSIISNLDSKLDDEIKAVNKRYTSCSSNLTEGIKNVQNIRCIASNIDADKEKDVTNDSNISSGRSSLSSEVSRCETKIEDLKSEIESLKSAIEAEKERLRAEACNKAKDALAGVIANIIG